MIKKSITYTNFADETVTEDFEFHLSKAEVGKMELSGKGNSMIDYLRYISREQNGAEIIKTMEAIVDKSYGVRTIDGKGFDKDPSHLRAFKASGAYDALFEELLMTDDSAIKSAEFVRGLFPSDMQAQVPTDPEAVKQLAQSQGFIPQGVKMPTDRQPKHSSETSDIKHVPFDGTVVNEPENSETLEQLRARIAEMEQAQN